MQFLTKDEARSVRKKLDRQIADKPRPRLVLHYRSGNHDYSKAANTITASIGEFTEVTLLYLFCVSGDGWSEGNDMRGTNAGGATGYGESPMATNAGSMTPQVIGSSAAREIVFPKS